MLHYLSRKCKNSRLLIIGTYRTEELIRAREERFHPLEETMFSMSREDLLSKIELNRLKRNDFPELLRSIFRSSFDEEFVEKLYRETEGNPLFALETLNILVQEGFLSREESRWILTAQMEKIRIPSKIHEVIIRRIAGLARQERKLLDLAAVCGNSFSSDILSRVLALDLADVLQTLVEIEQRHRLICSGDSTFEFTHHKIREVIYENLPGELRRVYHLKTASCLEQILAEKISDGYIADIALHYVEGGASERAFEYLVKLGEKAVNIHASVEAIQHLDKALEATQKDTNLASKENLAIIYKLRGKAWLGQGETTEAINDFNLFVQNAISMGDESMVTEAYYWLGSALRLAEKREECMLHLTKAVELARKTGNRFIEGRSLSGLAEPLIGVLDTMEEGRMRLEESFRICKEIGDKVTEFSNLEWLGMLYNWRGEFNQAKEALNEALGFAEELDNFSKLIALFFLGIVHAGKGEYNDAISTAQKCLQLSRDWDVVYFVPRVLNVLGWIYHDLSSIELALHHNNEALKTARVHQERIGVGAALPACLLNLGMDCLYKNDYENAEKFFKEAGKVVHLHRWVEWRFKTRILLGLGEISLAKSNYVQALKLAEDSLAISEKADAKKYIAKGLKLKAEILAKMGNSEEATKLMKDALKLAQQVGNPPLLWQIHYSLGLLLENQGNTQKANEYHAQAIALLETTASKLNDALLKSCLLTSPKTMTIRAAYTRTKPKP